MSYRVPKYNLAVIEGPQGPKERHVTCGLTFELGEPVFARNLPVHLDLEISVLQMRAVTRRW